MSNSVPHPFGSLAIRGRRTHGFASRPHGRYAFIEELVTEFLLAKSLAGCLWFRY